MDGAPQPAANARTQKQTSPPQRGIPKQAFPKHTPQKHAILRIDQELLRIASLIMRWPSRSRTTPLCLKIRRKPNRVLHMRTRGRDSTSCLTTAPAEVATIREYDGTDVPLPPVH